MDGLPALASVVIDTLHAMFVDNGYDLLNRVRELGKRKRAEGGVGQV